MINSPGGKLGLTFVDAEKAFDNLNWEYMIRTLEKMNFGTKFVNAIKGIYKEQKSYLIVNEEDSEGFFLMERDKAVPYLHYCSYWC